MEYNKVAEEWLNWIKNTNLSEKDFNIHIDTQQIGIFAETQAGKRQLSQPRRIVIHTDGEIEVQELQDNQTIYWDSETLKDAFNIAFCLYTPETYKRLY